VAVFPPLGSVITLSYTPTLMFLRRKKLHIVVDTLKIMKDYFFIVIHIVCSVMLEFMTKNNAVLYLLRRGLLFFHHISVRHPSLSVIHTFQLYTLSASILPILFHVCIHFCPPHVFHVQPSFSILFHVRIILIHHILYLHPSFSIICIQRPRPSFSYHIPFLNLSFSS
jgi:hypothetical protein